MPASLAPYSRIAFSGAGGLVDRGAAVVVPCGYEPAANALARLRTVLGSEGHSATEVHAPVRYGEEEAFVGSVAAQVGDSADAIVLLFSLAATPEDENHGVLATGVRDWIAANRPRAQLLVTVDEGPYRARMEDFAGRLEERRRAWRDFIAARGLEPRFVDLSQ